MQTPLLHSEDKNKGGNTELKTDDHFSCGTYANEKGRMMAKSADSKKMATGSRLIGDIILFGIVQAELRYCLYTIQFNYSCVVNYPRPFKPCTIDSSVVSSRNIEMEMIM